MRDSGRNDLHPASVASVAIFAVFLATQTAYGQGLTNGGFESGDFTGWTVTLHKADGPILTIAGEVDTGGQVLNGKEIWRDGAIKPGILGPEGTDFALISSTPGTEEDGADPRYCPISLAELSPAPDADGDGYDEHDATVLSQDFVVSSVPAQVSFMWSFLNGESTDPNSNSMHDSFEATLTPVAPPGPSIQLLGITAGNEAFFGPYSSFDFLDPWQFDGSTYEVLTKPLGGPADCFYVGEGWTAGLGLGRTPFMSHSTAIPSTGTWRLSFYFADDGDDERFDSGVIIDGVRVMTPPQAAGLCPAQPREDCIVPAAYNAGKLRIRLKAGDTSKNKIVWAWNKGPGFVNLGTPTTTTTYELCVYDAWGLAVRAAAPAGGTCADGKDCWTPTTSGFRYRDKDLTPNGLFKISMVSGNADGRSRIRVNGKGANLPMPTLPLVLPVTAQLVHSNDGGVTSTCFSNLFSKARRTTGEKFAGRSE